MLKKIAAALIAASFALASSAAMAQVSGGVGTDPTPGTGGGIGEPPAPGTGGGVGGGIPDDEPPGTGPGVAGKGLAKGHDKDQPGKGHAKGRDK